MSEFLSSIHPVAVFFIVCIAKIVEITIQSLKTCMMVKGQRLKAAGLGFAVSNSTEELKATADRVICSNNEDAIDYIKTHFIK